MALPATDSFTAANGTNLTAYSANWSYNGASVFAINTNSLYCNDADEGAAYWNADTFADDQYAQATVVAIGSGAYIGVSVRCASGANTFYGFEANSNDASYLFKYVAGTSTQLGSTGNVFAVSDVIRLEASGTTITPYVDGSTTGTPGAQTDSSIASGYAGVVGAGAFNTSRIDDWEGGNLSGGPVSLTVADASHTHSADNIALTQHNALVVADALHAHAADNVTLAAGVTLVVADALHAHAVDNVALTQHYVLVVADATHAHGVDNVTLLPIVGVCITGVLTASSNGRYFENDSGPIVLAGMHTWYNVQDGGDTDPPPVFDWDAYLAALVSYGHNATKLWRLETTEDWGGFPDQVFSHHAYARTGPGNAADGKLKFDLDTWNEEYFTRLRTRAIEAGNAGIYVIVQLFQGWHLDEKGFGTGDPWPNHPFADGNNINSVDGDVNNDGDGYELRDTSQTALYNRSLAFVDKMIATVGDLDHVLWEVSNEDTYSSTTLTWQRAIAAYLKANDAAGHPVGITKLWPGGSNANLTGSTDADWISPDDDWPVPDPDEADGSQVILYDTDHVFGVGTEYNWVLQSFAMGNNPIYMDEWDGALYGTDTRADADYILIRRLMGDAVAYSQRMDLANTTPQPTLSTTGWCLAKTTGRTHFFVYQDGTGAFDVNLTGIAGTLSLEWYRVSDGTTQAGSDVTGGASRTLTPPWAGAVAAFLEQEGYVLVVQDASHAHAADNVALTQHNALVVQDAAHSHTVDDVSVTQHNVLTVADTLHSHTVDSVVLTQHYVLVVADSAHAHTADNVALTQHHALTVADTLHSHAADNVTLTVAGQLEIQDGTHGHTADNVTLTQHNVLTVQDASHAHTVDSVALTQHYALVVADASHSHVADNVALSQHNVLTVAGALHAHTVDNITLTVAGQLTVQDASHAHSADTLTLTQHNVLAVDDATHGHSAEPVSLSLQLIVQDASHAHSAANVVLTQHYVLVVADALHSHTTGNVTLTQHGALTVADALHSHSAGNVGLDIGAAFVVMAVVTMRFTARSDVKMRFTAQEEVEL